MYDKKRHSGSHAISVGCYYHICHTTVFSGPSNKDMGIAVPRFVSYIKAKGELMRRIGMVLMEKTDKDQLLLTALQKGDSTAFEHIFKEYYPICCAYGSRFVNYEDAKEIAGDAILWLWEHRTTLQIDSSLSKYLLKSVYRRSLNSIKQKNLKYVADTMFYEEMENRIQNIDIYHIQELSKKIEEAIRALPPTYREAFVLHRFTKMNHKEIAAQLNVSTQTVAYRIQQATKLLRKDLSDFLLAVLAFLT